MKQSIIRLLFVLGVLCFATAAVAFVPRVSAGDFGALREYREFSGAGSRYDPRFDPGELPELVGSPM